MHGIRVTVVGLGMTGLSCVRWLCARGATVTVTDSRMHPPGAEVLQKEHPEVGVRFGALDVSESDLIVRSPGISKYEPALMAATAKIVGDIELFAQHIATWPSKVIAITGANGKTTVTSMVGAMIKASGVSVEVAGNIGLPVLDMLLEIEAGQRVKPAFFVLELSSFQLETTESLNAVSATVLNVTEDHLDRYTGMQDYADTKARIFQGNGVMVLNNEDPYCQKMVRADRQMVWFGQGVPASADAYGLDGQKLLQGKAVLLQMDDLQVTGRHNAANALAAIALCEAAGLARAPLVAALKTFQGLPHRVAFVAEIKGVRYYDDSKGTNVGATEAALRGMSSPVVLIAGGLGKGQDFTPLRAACQAHCRQVILIGQDAPILADVLAGVVPITQATSLEESVNLASATAVSGDVVLLSPACASMDMFKDYVARADAFVAAIQALKEGLK